MRRDLKENLFAANASGSCGAYDVQQMPTQWEQDIAKTHVSERPLYRPPINGKRVSLFSLFFGLVTGAVTYVICLVLHLVGGAQSSADSVYGIFGGRRIEMVAIVYASVVLAAVVICSKTIVIGAIRLYQHYAPEIVRRRCLFKPTCSEYAILAIRKFGIVRGLRKTLDRLVKRCNGDTYRIDYP